MNEGNFDDNYYCVYCHRNLANGKVYIGITNDTHNRWRSDGSGYANQPLFWNAIQKYGWDGFEHIILIDRLSLEDAQKYEKEYISKFQSNAYRYSNPQRGYNLTDGGEGFCGVDRRGNKNSFYGKHHTDGSKKKMSDSKKGYKNHFFGKSLSNQEIEALIAPKRKMVICVTDGMIYASMAEAARHYNITHSGISQCCNGKTQQIKGLRFKYADCDNQPIDADKNKKHKWFLCIDTGNIFNSTASASRLTGDSQPAIWDCCNNRRGKTNAGKYSWRYATDEEVGNNLRGVSGNV